MKRRTLLSWSSGKDSAWALHLLRQAPDIEVIGLFTTINESYQRVAMHGVHLRWLKRQAAAAGLPLAVIPLPQPCTDHEYGAIMARFLQEARSRGVEVLAFGDLFLADVRTYREKQLHGTGLEPLFPLWGLPTHALAQTMVNAGLRAVLTCVDTARLPSSFAGRSFDAALLAELPAGIDACGENGEFHTFACAGPMFRQVIAVSPGNVIERDGFAFAELVPAVALDY